MHYTRISPTATLTCPGFRRPLHRQPPQRSGTDAHVTDGRRPTGRRRRRVLRLVGAWGVGQKLVPGRTIGSTRWRKGPTRTERRLAADRSPGLKDMARDGVTPSHLPDPGRGHAPETTRRHRDFRIYNDWLPTSAAYRSQIGLACLPTAPDRRAEIHGRQVDCRRSRCVLVGHGADVITRVGRSGTVNEVGAGCTSTLSVRCAQAREKLRASRPAGAFTASRRSR